MHLFLIRHGQSEGNVTGRLQGWQDAPLTALGERQARHTATALRQFLQQAGVTIAALYSSPLQRAFGTAGAIGQALGCPVHREPGLREMHFGRVEGLTEAEWQARFPELLPAWRDLSNLDFGWPAGETRRGFHTRIQATIEGLRARHAPHDHLVLVTHGGVISAYLAYLLTGDWQQWGRYRVANCGITHLTLEPGDLVVPALSCLLRFNDRAHLPDADLAATLGPG